MDEGKKEYSFTITQFFQVLKQMGAPFESSHRFYDNSILPGTKTEISNHSRIPGFTITQFFQVLKPLDTSDGLDLSFTITQFFQVLKLSTGSKPSLFCFTITQFFQVLKHQICPLSLLILL